VTNATPDSDLSGEFERLGQNLKAAARTAWESEESRKLQAELKSSISALEAGLKQAAQEVRAGEAGQRLKSEAADLGERVKSGQVESELRQGLLSALRTINAELQKMSRPQPPDEA
jgi:hypothetical protein